ESVVVAKVLTEAEKMQQIPGIWYMDGPAGRRAHVDHCSLDVWEIVRDYLAAGRDEARTLRGLDWVTPAQLHTALDFYAAFPEEIDTRLGQERETWIKLFGDAR
ncbi:MAG: DUF433 domain-containing protein, partial [Dehalococcoidia bacterium]